MKKKKIQRNVLFICLVLITCIPKVYDHFFFHFLVLFSFSKPRLDKRVYTSGETASLHVDVKNNSNVDIDSFIVKVGETEDDIVINNLRARKIYFNLYGAMRNL